MDSRLSLLGIGAEFNCLKQGLHGRIVFMCIFAQRTSKLPASGLPRVESQQMSSDVMQFPVSRQMFFNIGNHRLYRFSSRDQRIRAIE